MLIMMEMTQSRQCELLEHDMTAEHVKGFKEEDLYLTTAEYLKKNVNDDNKKEIISDMKDFLSSCERNNTERLPCKENNTNSQSLLKQTCQFRDKAKVAKDKESASLVRERNLQKLHQILIDPIKDALDDEKHLIIVPDKDLFALPFAALQNENNEYLIERYTLSIVPSLVTILELKEKIANPTIDNNTVRDNKI